MLLDRDGVLNRAFERAGVTHPPHTLGELEILPGVPAAVQRLRAAGFALVGVSNQPDIARGRQTHASVDAINATLVTQLGLLDVLVCAHDTGDDCACRKPRPGLLLAAAARFDLDLARSFMVGDRWSDVLAGQAAGCHSILIETPWSDAARCEPEARVGDLTAAAEYILAWTRASNPRP